MSENANKISNYTFCFQCPVGWESLDSIGEEKVRFCQLCKKDVYFVETQTELDSLSNKGSCVAFVAKDSELEKTKNQATITDKSICKVCGTKFHPQNTFCLNCGEVNPNSTTNSNSKIKLGVPEGVVMGQILPTAYCSQCYCELPFESRYEILCQKCKLKSEPLRPWWKFWG